MLEDHFLLPSPLEEVDHELFAQHEVKFYIKRDDLIHSEISGNKWRKLKYNLEAFTRSDKKSIVTYGGAFSNHIAATAKACQLLKIPVKGIIRGEELSRSSNPTLSQAHKLGMELEFVSRSTYKLLKDSVAENHQFDRIFHIPEGGFNVYGIKGCKEIISEIDINFDEIIVSYGTGTTFFGLLQSVKNARICAIQVLKGVFVRKQIEQYCSVNNIDPNIWKLHDQYHFGGYARFNQELIDFINRIKAELSINLDPVYTGKSFYAVWNMIKAGKFDGKTLIFLHTGGLQGIEGFNQMNRLKQGIE